MRGAVNVWLPPLTPDLSGRWAATIMQDLSALWSTLSVSQTTRNETFSVFTLSDIVDSVWRFKWSVILICAIVLPLLLIGIMFVPEKFDSHAQLLVRLGRGSVSLDPTTGMTNTVSVQESRISQVNSVKELFGSRALAESVVDKIGAERILEPHSTIETWMTSLTGMIPRSAPSAWGELSEDEVGEQIQREEAVNKVQDALSVSTAKDAYTINLHVRTGSPFLSRDLLEAYVDSYTTYHIKAYQNAGSVGFFEKQAQQAYDHVVKTQNELQRVKSEAGISELSAAKAALRATTSEIQGVLLNTSSELVGANSEIQQLQDEMKETPKQVDSEVVRGIPKQLGDGMRQTLYALEVQYKDMQSKLAANNPKLVAIRDQIEEARKIADSETGEQPQTVEAINPVYQQLEVAYRTAMVKHAGLVAKEAALKNQLVELEQKLVVMNQAEVTLTRLEWEFSLAEEDYLQFARSRNEANQVASLDSQRLSEISVAQEATLGLKKASPKRAMLAVFAAVFTCVLGFGQAVIRGLFVPANEPPVASSRDQARRRSDTEDWGESVGDGETHGRLQDVVESVDHDAANAEASQGDLSHGDVKLNRPPH